MSEEIIPGAENTPDVGKNEEVEKDQSTLNDVVENINESVVPDAEEETPQEQTVDLGNLTLAELSERFDKLSQAEDRMKRYKEAEAIKSAFYRRLSKEKADAGLG